MKRAVSALLLVCLILSSSLTAYAQVSVSYSDNSAQTDAEWVDWTAPAEAASPEPSQPITEHHIEAEPPAPLPAFSEESAVSPPESIPPVSTPEPTAAPSPQASSVYPSNVETVTENGMVLVKKTYILSPDADPEKLVEEFMQGDLHFTLRDILREDLPGETLTRPARKFAITTTDSDKQSDILTQFPATIEYCEDGYSGLLLLDSSSLVTEPEEYEAYSYTYTETEELGPLGRNDPALLEKERQGMTMVGLSFDSPPNGGTAPSSYIGTITWQGTKTGYRPVSYTTTATYSGEISRTVPGNVLYTLVYEGSPVQEELPSAEETPAKEEQPAEPTPEKQKPTREWWQIVLLVILSAAGLSVVVTFILHTKNDRERRRENREALEEIARFIRGED